MKAIVLINIETGEIQFTLRELKRIRAVQRAYLTFGPYDAICIIELDDLHAIGRIVEYEIQTLPGVRNTCTCLMVEGEIESEIFEELTNRTESEILSLAEPGSPVAA